MSSTKLLKFRVRLAADNGDGPVGVDEGIFYARSEKDAEECAMDAFWDPRLDAADCSPVFHTEELDAEDDDDKA